MGKQETREERNKRYNDFFGISQEELATKKRNQGSTLVPEGDIGYLAQDKIGKSKYDQDFMPGLDFFMEKNTSLAREMAANTIDENRAQLQPASEKWLHGAGRVLSKTGTEFAKGIGYLGGGVGAIFTGDIETMTNNAFVNVFQELEDSAKESLPVYTREAIENGGFWDQVWSPEFWATEGADGLGFLLSAFLTGGTVAGISKSAQIGTKVAQLINKGASIAGKIDEALITGVQTFVESAAETKGMVDELKHYWESRKNEDGTYTAEDGSVLNEKDVKELIGNSAISTLALNSLFLTVPNHIQTKYLFGKGDVPTGLLSKLDNATPEMAKEALSKIVPWRRAGSLAVQKGLKSAGAEAFQELSQFAIEDYENKKGKGVTNQDLISGLAEGFYEGITTIEGQKSMFLGAVLGLGPAAISTYRDRKKEIENTGGLLDLLSKSTAAMKSDITSIYNKNEDGSIKYDSKGRPEINQEKYAEIIDSNIEDLTIGQIYQAGKIQGNTHVAKKAISDMTLRHLYPYLNVEGGMDIWEQYLNAFSETIENDYKALGFKSKEDYTSFMKDIGSAASEAYVNVKEKGPAFYGISKKNAQYDNIDTETLNKELDKFISQVEYQSVRYKVFESQNNRKIEAINEEQSEIEKRFRKENPDSDKVIDGEYLILEALKKNIEKDNKILKENYQKLFDKKEQEKAFNSIVNEISKSKKNQEESSDETSEYGPNEDTRTEDEKFIDSFYDNLRTKGYDVNKGSEAGNDFGKGVVTLKDNNDNIYRVIKQFNKNTNTNDYQILNISNGHRQKFTLDLVKKLGFNSVDNILSKEEFKKWDNSRKIVEKNNRRLETIKEVISRHFENRKSKKTRIDSLKEELDNYRRELEIARELDPNMTIDSLTEDVITLESKKDLVEEEIKILQKDIQELNSTLGLLLETQSELMNAIQNEQEYSFGIKLLSLKEQIENNEFETNVKLVDESIEYNKELEKELLSTYFKINQSLNSLYERLSELSDIDNLFSNINSPTGLANKLKKNHPDLEINGTVIGDINRIQIKKLLKDPEIRRGLIERVRAEKAEIMPLYALTKNEMASVKKELKDVENELKRLLTNKVVATKYNKLKINYETLINKNNFSVEKQKVEELKNLKNNAHVQNLDLKPEEQDDTAIDEHIIKKNNPFSTSSQIWKAKRTSTGKYIVEKDKYGNNVLNDNYQQGARWDSVMADIPLTELDKYGVRFVNSSQLKELGVEPPSDIEGDIYAILHKNNKPYLHENELVFTGVPFTSTMFGEDWTSIDIERVPEYAPYLNKIIDDNNPVTYKGIEYTDVNDLKQRILEVLREEYESFRNKIVEKVNKGEIVKSKLKDISSGIPQYSKDKNNPKNVLDVESIVIPDSSTITKDNNSLMEVQPGRVYVKLKNGQLVRTLNNKILDLPENARKDMLNKIIKFISLAKFVENADFRQEFFFEGKNTKEKIPLIGDNKKAGILDHFINWGISKDKPVGIAIFPIDKNDLTKGYELRFKFNNKSHTININDLFDSTGNVKDYSDPSLMELVDFLENKYLNVNSTLLNKNNQSIKIPKSYNPKTQRITYDKVDSMQDYYMDNQYIYTNIKKQDKELDEIPQFVNRYVTYESNLVPELPEITEKVKAEPVEEKATTKSLKELKKEKTTEFFDNPPPEIYNEDDGSYFKGLMDNFDAKEFNEPESVKEDKEVCKTVKKPGANFKRRKKK